MRRVPTIIVFLSALLMIVSTLTLDAQGYFFAPRAASQALAAAAGDLDATFGSGGKVVTDFFGSRDYVSGIAIQPDGKIVAVGTVLKDTTTFYFGLARYNTDGTLDQSFGTGGKVTTGVIMMVNSCAATAVAIQPDGKIVVAGAANYRGYALFALARYNTDGSLDNSFGAGGGVVTDMPGFSDIANAIAIQPDGKIVVVGKSDNLYIQSYTSFLAIARYNTNGSLDSTFGTGGIFYSYPASSEGHAVAVQPDGKIVVLGVSRGGRYLTYISMAVWRFNGDGSYDTGSGSIGPGPILNTGDVITDLSTDISIGYGLALQRGGQIVIAGYALKDTTVSFMLMRLNSDRRPDPYFGSGGEVTIDYLPRSAVANAVALQPDGKIVAAGYAYLPYEVGDFAIARCNTDGSRDTSFGDGGKVTTDFGSPSNANAVALQPDGKFVVAGFAGTGSFQDFALARYNDSGPFDLCAQDESNGNILLINSDTGDYKMTNCAGFAVTGRGSIERKGSYMTLEHFAPDHRVLARIDYTQNTATASIQLFSPRKSVTILDKNILNNSCSCN